MQAVILAGGRGERLMPLTDNIPKSMVDINGRPFLALILESLIHSGIKEIFLCVGYLSEKIIEYFGNGSKWGCNITYSIEKELLGTGGALKKIFGYIKDDFLVLNGDTYIAIDHNEIISYFVKRNEIGLALVYRNSEAIEKNNMYITEKGVIKNYIKSGSDSMNCIDAGTQLFRKDLFEYLKDCNPPFSLEEKIFPRLIRDRQLLGFVTNQRYYDIGTPQRLDLIRRTLR